MMMQACFYTAQVWCYVISFDAISVRFVQDWVKN